MLLALFPAASATGADPPRPLQTGPDKKALRALEIDLRSSDKWARKTAVEKLAELGTKEAWQKVVEALADPKGEVADTAELLLGGLADPELLDLLAGKEGLRAKDARVRQRAAEALGRMDFAVDVRLLVDVLNDRESDVRRMALFSIERLARAELLAGETAARLVPAVQRVASLDREDAVRARALLALAVLDEGRARAMLAEAATDRSPGMRTAAAALLPRLERSEIAAGVLARLAADPARAVRVQAANALAELGTHRAALALAERLATEVEERLVLRILDHLQALSGLKYPRDPRPWRDWAAALPGDWARARAPAPGPRSEGGTTATLAGMPILSTRIAILIDLSGSIWMLRANGRTRKELVDQKLREALMSLPEKTLFNVIPYTGTPRPWQEELMPATKQNVQAAARFFEETKDQGTGNFWDAAMLALEDPEVDTLLVLFDGVPTGGARYQPDLIALLFLEWNRTRQVVLDTILVDAPPRIRRPWQELSEATGGLSIAIEL